MKELTYERIAEVNSKVKYTNVRGKNYAEVAQRVQAFRNLIPGGFITTDIIRHDPGIVYMKSEVGYYENGNRVVLATGMAFERQDASNINKTSYIENCETSAIGRALGFIGLGSESSIASAEEVSNAIATQEAIENGSIPDPSRQDAPADVNTVPSLPGKEEDKESNPVLTYLAKERKELMTARGVTQAVNNDIWKKQIVALTAAGLIPNKALKDFTKEEAERMIAFMYSKFTPTGTEIKTDDGQTA